ncbi:MAG: hypothetical protein NW206_19665 [Hyphomonadaceae bacterium]|nr:hypothetical protein [Hyphomonadaceae bacterium]
MTLTARQQLDAALKAQAKGKGRAGAPRAKWTRDKRGRNHPSEGEALWFNALYDAEARGELVIEEVEPSFRIELHAPGELAGVYLCTVKADARVRELVPPHMKAHRAERVRVIDYKGRSGDTEVSRLKRKMVRIQHGVEIEWVGKYVEGKARAKAKKKAARELIKRQGLRAKR